MTKAPLDLEAVQAQLGSTQGRNYWRSLEELAETPEFADFLHREFPRQASEWTPALSRRGFLKLMGASLALAGLTACASPPPEHIVPYVLPPEETVPGQSLFFATAMQLGGYSMGLLAQSQLNRPTKIEGNPDHPASLGATDAFAQASVLTLYDPDRAKAVTKQGAPSNWAAFLAELQGQLAQQRSRGGAGLHLLLESVTSPTLYSQLQAIFAQFPNAIWHQYEPVNRDNVYAGAALAFGRAVEPIYHFEQANVIVSLDADIFMASPGRVRYARDFADGRRADLPAGRQRNRLYAVESTPTLTGSAADHRLPLRAAQVELFARALAGELGVAGVANAGNHDEIPAKWVAALARDLQAHAGSSLIVAGDHQPPVVHALAHVLNVKLGNVGKTVIYTEPVLVNPGNQTDSLPHV